MKTRAITVVAMAIVAVSLTASTLLARRIDRVTADARLDDTLFLPSARVLKRVSLGYNTLLAEIYWTRAVQYFGSRHHDGSSRYESLYSLLDLTTDLDPHLDVAYQFGSIFLSQAPPEGAGQPRLAIQLVEKGIRRIPGNWKLYYNLGWIQASEMKDYGAAAQVFARGARVEGANPSLGVLAASMAQHGGDAATARLLWLQIYETTENDAIRANAVKRLRALRADAEIVQLEQALAQFRQGLGRLPRNWAEMEAAGWRGPTVDPAGNLYRILPDGRVEVADPVQLPFLTRGLPPDKASGAPSLLPGFPDARPPLGR